MTDEELDERSSPDAKPDPDSWKWVIFHFSNFNQVASCLSVPRVGELVELGDGQPLTVVEAVLYKTDEHHGKMNAHVLLSKADTPAHRKLRERFNNIR